MSATRPHTHTHTLRLSPLLPTKKQTKRIAVTVDVALATPAPDMFKPRQGHGPFDTYRFVSELESAGVSREEAVVIMEQVLLAISEANTRQITLVSEQTGKRVGRWRVLIGGKVAGGRMGWRVIDTFENEK